MDKSATPVPIIQHADVRRMMLTMKAYVEGMRSLLYYVGMCADRVKISEDDAQKDKFQGLIDLLIPVAKAMSPTGHLMFATLASKSMVDTDTSKNIPWNNCCVIVELP